MNEVVIGVGSNIDSEMHIEKARLLLNDAFGILKETALLTTKPVGFTEQPDFKNGAFFVRTDLEVTLFKTVLMDIEVKVGRTPRSQKFGPREIDLDILVWNKKVVDKDVFTRDFLRTSILEVYPDFVFE